MTDELRAAVERLYEVFARYPRNGTIGYCGHCVSDDEARVLHEVPLRKLTAGQLECFAWKAMSTWGEESDFQHFLPRILELFALRELADGCLLGKVLGTVTLCGRQCRSEDREAVEGYRVALWNDFLAVWPGVFTPMKVLEALGEFDQSTAIYLDIWARTPGEAAARHLADFASDFLVSVWSDRPFCHELDAWWAAAPRLCCSSRPGPPPRPISRRGSTRRLRGRGRPGVPARAAVTTRGSAWPSQGDPRANVSWPTRPARHR